MGHASTHGVCQRRAFALLIALPLAGWLLHVATPSAALAVDPAKAAAAKAAAKPAATPVGNPAEVVKLIDDKLEAGWKENKLTPSRMADDYEFIRRASLDIIGRIATHDEIIRFEKDPKE